jgi:hypothetical protein
MLPASPPSIQAVILEPCKAQFKKIDTLADLGIQDFRLNHAEKNLFLDFPAVIWKNCVSCTQLLYIRRIN